VSVAASSASQEIYLQTMSVLILFWFVIKQFNAYKAHRENICSTLFNICLLGICAVGIAKLAACSDTNFCTTVTVPGFDSYIFWCISYFNSIYRTYAFILGPAVVVGVRIVIGFVYFIRALRESFHEEKGFSSSSIGSIIKSTLDMHSSNRVHPTNTEEMNEGEGEEDESDEEEADKFEEEADVLEEILEVPNRAGTDHGRRPSRIYMDNSHRPSGTGMDESRRPSGTGTDHSPRQTRSRRASVVRIMSATVRRFSQY
jgi:hypothetical protein